MPVDGLALHPLATTLPAAGYGILMRLLMHFWVTDLAPLPKSDRELRSIGRAHVPVWKAHKDAILSVFNDISGELVAYHRMRATKADELRIAARRNAAEVKARARAAHLAKASPALASPLAPTTEANPTPRPVPVAKRVARKPTARMSDRRAA
jgi:uncharacterized protein YdaU (DUF1376 family)